MDRAYAATGDEVLRHFQVDSKKGLSSQQVEEARRKYGTNGTHSRTVRELC